MTETPRWAFRPGLELSEALFEHAVGPIIERRYPRLRYGFARLAHGSDVLGFDTPLSMDHGWGPRGTLFLAQDELERLAPELGDLLARELPLEVLGVPTHLDAEDLNVAAPQRVTEGPVRHGVRFASPVRFFKDHLGFDPEDDVTPLDWLTAPSQRLRTIASGRVFHDSLNALVPRRAAVQWYPQDLWAYLMASQWRRIGQEEAFVARAGDTGDELGSRVLASRLCRDLMHLAFLQERQHAPYAKWFGRAFDKLACAGTLGPALYAVAEATGWRERERELSRAYRIVAQRQNALGVGDPPSAEMRAFHGRPYEVIGGERFAAALERAITDSSVASLPRGIGAVWQLSDSADLLEDIAACRSLGVALFA